MKVRAPQPQHEAAAVSDDDPRGAARSLRAGKGLPGPLYSIVPFLPMYHVATWSGI